jgi:hypothetical protein
MQIAEFRKQDILHFYSQWNKDKAKGGLLKILIVASFTKYQDDQIKYEMGGTCSIYEKNVYKSLLSSAKM